jgi:CRP-like cAMP-binding protein
MFIIEQVKLQTLAFMFEKLRAFFERGLTLTDQHFEFIKAQFHSKKIKKGEVIFREGEIAKYGMFVASGCLRTYIIDNKGKEHIIQFSPENWWVADMDSFTTGVQTQYFLDAVEDSELLLCDNISFTKILEYVPGLAAQYQAGIQKHTAAKNQRIALALSASAQERYGNFLKAYPSLVQRLPLHMIASYLGITPETLSRVRRHLCRNH